MPGRAVLASAEIGLAHPVHSDQLFLRIAGSRVPHRRGACRSQEVRAVMTNDVDDELTRLAIRHALEQHGH